MDMNRLKTLIFLVIAVIEPGASEYVSSAGTSFHLAVPLCFNQSSSPSFAGEDVQIFISAESAASILINGGSLSSPVSLSLPAQGTVSHSLDYVQTVASVGLETRGLVLTSTSPVSVYMYVLTGVGPLKDKNPQAAIGMMLFPDHWLDTEYYIVNVAPDPGGGGFGPFSAYMTIVATHDTTTIEIQNYDTVARQFKTIITQTMSVHETYTYRNTSTDFTGYRVQSSLPVAVISGNEMANPPYPLASYIPLTSGSSDFSDPVAEMLPPTSMLGSLYLTLPSDTVDNRTLYKVVMSEKGNVSYDNVIYTVTHAGGFVSFLGSTSATEIRCTAACMVAHIQGANGASENAYMVILPPVSKYGKASTLTPHTLFTSQEVIYTISTNNPSVLLDGNNITVQSITTLSKQVQAAGSGYTSVSCSINISTSAALVAHDDDEPFLSVFVQKASHLSTTKSAVGHTLSWAYETPQDSENPWWLYLVIGLCSLVLVIAVSVVVVIILKRKKRKLAEVKSV